MMIEYKLRYRVDFSCYCFINCPFTEIMLPFSGERVVVHLLLLFIFCFSNFFQFPIYGRRHRPPTRASFLSLDSQAYLQHHTTTHEGRSHKSSRTEKKGVRFFLNICSLLCSRVFSVRVGSSLWPETFLLTYADRAKYVDRKTLS